MEYYDWWETEQEIRHLCFPQHQQPSFTAVDDLFVCDVLLRCGFILFYFSITGIVAHV